MIHTIQIFRSVVNHPFKQALCKLAFLLFLSLNFNQAWAKSLVTEVDSRQIEMGDIISVRVIADFQSFSQAPDFDGLKDQFDVLGSQRSSNVQIVNGQYSSTTEWLAQMTPKQTGELRIPSFEIEGARSSPITIQVTQAREYGTQNQISFIEAELNKTDVLVQEEVIYSLRFFHLGRLIDGSIRPPQFGDALVKQLKNQLTYQKKINGQIYDVFEWRYAFYPQHSGELVIEPQDFTGRLQLGGQLRAIHDNSPKLTLKVNPKPSQFPASASWLPATKVALSETWQTANQHQNELHVGDSLTRTLKLQAVGQLGSQLPSLSFENQAGIQIYPDQAQTHEEPALDGYRSEKLFKMAIIPTQAGQLTLPEITLKWWNTATQSLETLVLPAKTLDVLPALNSAVSLAKTPVATSDPIEKVLTSNSHTDSAALRGMTTSAMAYPLMGLGILWLLTLGAWAWQVRQTQHLKRQLLNLAVANPAIPEQIQSASERPATVTNVCQNPLAPEEFYRFLNQHLQTLPNWQSQPELVEHITRLKAHLFKTPQIALPDHWQAEICAVLKNTPQIEPPKMATQLQTLYPE